MISGIARRRATINIASMSWRGQTSSEAGLSARAQGIRWG